MIQISRLVKAMNEYEIVRSYKNASDPPHHVSVLCQLHGLSKDDVVSVLNKHGISPAMPRVGVKNILKPHLNVIRQMMLRGATNCEIAKKYGVNAQSVQAWRVKWGL